MQPRKTDQLPPDRSSSGSSLAAEVGVPRCLIIDDDLDSREGYAEYLRVHGFDVDTLGDARTALSLIRARRPDIVLLDLQLPHLDGWEFLRRLRKDRVGPGLPVIAISACVFPDDRRRAAEAGCDTFLAKPCLPNEVLDNIRALLGPPGTTSSRTH